MSRTHRQALTGSPVGRMVLAGEPTALPDRTGATVVAVDDSLIGELLATGVLGRLVDRSEDDQRRLVLVDVATIHDRRRWERVLGAAVSRGIPVATSQSASEWMPVGSSLAHSLFLVADGDAFAALVRADRSSYVPR